MSVRGKVAEAVALLEQQGHVTEIADAQQRIAAMLVSCHILSMAFIFTMPLL